MNKEYKPLWKTVIEQHGGYKKCKDILKNPNIDFIMNAQALRGHMLEYRRQHNIYEVGDKVVFKNNWTANDLVLTIGGTAKNSIRLDTVLDLKKHFRHATDAEIKAGKRL